MEIGEIRDYLKPGMEQVEALILASLRSDVALLESTNRSLREHRGKMLRPMLALLTAGACGQANDATLHYAAAVELLHNASLIHDDVVDRASERHGMPSVASLLDNSSATLVGDFWLVRCLRLVLSASVEPNRVLNIYADTLGAMAEGELLQLEKSGTGDTTEADYLRILYGKTASLFESAALSAAISVGADDATVRLVGDFGRSLGLVFQIKDDIMDYASGADALGKPVGIDLREQKITQPLLCALEDAAPSEAADIRSKVVRIADEPALEDEVRRFVRERDGVQKAAALLDERVEKTIGLLAGLPETKEKTYLAALARYAASREK